MLFGINIKCTLALIALFLPVSLVAAPLYPLTPNKLQNISIEEFVEKLPQAIQKAIDKNLNGKDFVRPDFSKVKVGDRLFLPFQVVHKGQPEISSYYVLDKLNEALVGGSLLWSNRNQHFTLVHNEGRSLFGVDNCASGIVVGDKVFLNDGNTKAEASLLVGATEYCVSIKGIYLEDSIEDPTFRRRMADEGLLFIWDSHGNEVESLPSWKEAADHPGRTFMVQRRVKVKAHFDFDSRALVLRTGSSSVPPVQALFIKINNDVPFVELKLWIAALKGFAELIEQESTDEEIAGRILAMDKSEESINLLLRAIRKGIESGHPAMKGLVDVFLLDNYGQFRKESQVEAAVTERIFSHCEPLLNLPGR